MEENRDLTVLLKVTNKPLAQEIQNFLADGGIYTLLKSDNAMSSALSMYVGSNNVFESISVYVANDSYLEAVKLLEETSYFEFLAYDEEEADENFEV